MPAGARGTEYGLNADHSTSSSPVTGALQLSREPTSTSSKVQIQIDSETFVLDRDRLAAVCPQFATMFSLPTSPQTAEEQVVPLHNKLEHFKAFVWYLEVHPQAFFAWRDTPDTPDKCRLLFGVAAVTHMYEAHDVTVWALELALNMLELHTRPFVPEPELLGDLYTFTQKIWMDVGHLPGRPNNVLHWQRVEAIWMDVLSVTTTNAIPYLLEAKKIHNSTLEAICYFYTLRIGATAISTDKRLSTEDRRRLLTGSHAFALRGQPLGENTWSTPPAPGAISGQWQPRKDPRIGDIGKLWDMFASPPWDI